MNPNQNALLDNYQPFQDDKNAPNKGRLSCQLIIGIFLLLIRILSIIELINSKIKTVNIILLMIIITNILNLIIGIWMITLSIKGQTTRVTCLGITSLISLIICLLRFFTIINRGNSVLRLDPIDIILLIIATSYNMKCQCCE
jgi:heme A synthase